MVDYKKQNEFMQNSSTDLIILLNRQIKKMDLHLQISISSLIVVLFLYFYIQEFLNLFYLTILLSVVFISVLFAILPRLKTIEITLTLGKNIEATIVIKRGAYAVLLIIASLIVILVTNFLISLFIIVLLLFFFLNELKIISKEGKLQKVFQKSPVVLFSIFVILIAAGFIVKMIPDFFPFLIEISITFIFTMFLFESFSEIEVPKGNKKDENDKLRAKVEEIFGEKTCEIHPSQIPSLSCLRCHRDVCVLCKSSYENLCAHCYKAKIETRILLFKFLTYLSLALFTIFLISFVWGIYAPLPQILSLIEWAGLTYNRFIVLFYYAIANFIILITLGGGSLFVSRQLKIKINQLESDIKEESG